MSRGDMSDGRRRSPMRQLATPLHLSEAASASLSLLQLREHLAKFPPAKIGVVSQINEPREVWPESVPQNIGEILRQLSPPLSLLFALSFLSREPFSLACHPRRVGLPCPPDLVPSPLICLAFSAGHIDPGRCYQALDVFCGDHLASLDPDSHVLVHGLRRRWCGERIKGGRLEKRHNVVFVREPFCDGHVALRHPYRHAELGLDPRGELTVIEATLSSD